MRKRTVITNGGTAGSISGIDINSNGTYSIIGPIGSFNAPVGVAVDPSGSIWTANSGDNTVSQLLTSTPPATTPLAAIVGP